jgi:23S rRNA (adenine(2503)-C(2))-methyltransferase
MDNIGLEKFLLSEKMPKYRLDQIKKAIFKDGVSSFTEISTLPKSVREELDKKIKILSFHPENILKSLDSRSIKALLKLKDGKYVETVLISPVSGTWSACVSSQVGCSMGCQFCATGQDGFKRNLTCEEITDQILFWKQYLKKNKISGIFSNIVYMGMGEPFLNWKEVEKSIEDLTNPKLFGFGSRSLSVSTVGVKGGIEKLAKIFPQVNLAISLHFGSNAKRSEFMPINKDYNLDDLKISIAHYFQKTKRKIFLEYIMLADINDSRKDADDLIKFIKSTENNYLLHVNLIKYNETPGKFASSTGVKINDFKNYLASRGINVTIRKSLGEDIQGACGQLAARLDSRR